MHAVDDNSTMGVCGWTAFMGLRYQGLISQVWRTLDAKTLAPLKMIDDALKLVVNLH